MPAEAVPPKGEGFQPVTWNNEQWQEQLLANEDDGQAVADEPPAITKNYPGKIIDLGGSGKRLEAYVWLL